MRRRALLAILLSATCGACHRQETTAPAAKSPTEHIADRQPVRQDMLAVAGRWRSRDGVPAPRRAVVIDLSSTASYVIEIRRTATGHDEIVETAVGHATRKDGAISGVGDEPQKGMLAKLSTWRMTITADGGTLEYDGKSIPMERIAVR